ncbi:hypothetical protein NHX12_014695 [Muraenolepis orangiensis]|uniref:Ig-like domain-containing protein n=1 Tax=Muraenolepis orangiensis TaxID=630683 RepID=A0A9Q0I375_9TELE|nr:hypothetical protein NHX12_014695 [Muraenolepis orangiensis]
MDASRCVDTTASRCGSEGTRRACSWTLSVTPVSDRDFGRYNCTARNNIGLRHQEFILAQADVPSNPYSVRLSAVC